MKTLVIVESPTKARTISKFLGKEYEIKSSMGHIIDLPKSKLGVAVEDNFAPAYEVVAAKKKIIGELTKSAKDADVILLATDPDREGEAIASTIRDVLVANKKLKISNEKFKRIVFHEITKEAIEDALRNPRDVDVNLVNAQTARRVLDRLVGYQLSPVLWRKIRRGLSAGRVQSVALRLIVEREREREKFVQEKYFSVHAILSQKSKVKSQNHNSKVKSEDGGTEFFLIEINGEKIETAQKFTLYDGEYKVSKTIIDSQLKADEIVKNIEGNSFVIADVAQRQMKRSPYAPFTTSTLQQDASRRFGFSGKRTMSLAQKLYEEGHITYHRTDSVNLSSSAIAQIRSYVQKE
ncbi:DNA topoisomerase I, partial [Patescibacteria group bacterium]|nr:DNA topoisomerase I [Patescibacteria group bacterium]